MRSMKLADEENVELTDEQLEFLASGGCGGCRTFFYKCPENKMMKRPYL